jgi:hypothetical protein
MEIKNTNKVGRKPQPVIYKTVIYNNNEYIVGSILSIHRTIQYLFDKDDFEKIKQKNWYKISSGYIASNITLENGERKQLLLHNFVLNRITFPGKGAAESVDHINRNPMDNRKENLRIVSQTEQNLNQKKKPRNVVQLPENCGIEPNEIPKHIWYIKPNGGHGDRFAIEFKTENLVWKSSSSKKISLKEKLNQAKEKLDELYIQYPYLNPNTNENTIKAQELCKSFHEIIVLSETMAPQ